MTNADIREVHKLLDSLFDNSELSHAQIDLIRGLVPELPTQMTLEEIAELVNEAWGDTNVNEWDDDAHGHLESWLSDLEMQLRGLANTETALPAGMRLADHEEYGRVVVSPGVGINKCHEIFYLDPGMSSGTDISEVEPDSLTFVDAESAKPAHPEFLETEADYENAPEDTIVAVPGRVPRIKESSGDWVCVYGRNSSLAMATSGRRYVLRWGWGK